MTLLDEIQEQPDAAARFLDRRLGDVRAIAATILRRDPAFVLIAARGTSDHAAIYAQYAFGLRNGIAVALAAPSMFSLYGAPPRLDRRGRARDLAVGHVAGHHRGRRGGPPPGRAERRDHERPRLARSPPPRTTSCRSRQARSSRRRPRRRTRRSSWRSRRCRRRCRAAGRVGGRCGRSTRCRGPSRPRWRRASRRARSPTARSSMTRAVVVGSRLRVRHGARVGAQAPGAHLRDGPCLVVGRLRARPARPARTRLPGPRGDPERRRRRGAGPAPPAIARRPRRRPRRDLVARRRRRPPADAGRARRCRRGSPRSRRSCRASCSRTTSRGRRASTPSAPARSRR